MAEETNCAQARHLVRPLAGQQAARSARNEGRRPTSAGLCVLCLGERCQAEAISLEWDFFARFIALPKRKPVERGGNGGDSSRPSR